ncbi:hypothetical protein BG004_000912 [Podila humilis]|nr:hypothetical protein BG004_000912 [Podila humilis]
MQNDAFKRFSRDLQEALVIPVNYLNKKAKKIPSSRHDKKNKVGASSVVLAGLQAGAIGPYSKSNNESNNNNFNSKSYGGGGGGGEGLQHEKIGPQYRCSDSVSLHNFSLSTISKTSVDDNQSFTSHGSSSSVTLASGMSANNSFKFGGSTVGVATAGGGYGGSGGGGCGGNKSSLKSPLSPKVFTNHGSLVGGSGGFASAVSLMREDPPLVHCPPSVATLDQFSPERLAWVKDCIYQQSNMTMMTTSSATTIGTTTTKPSLLLSSSTPSSSSALVQPNDVLKTSSQAWDTIEGGQPGLGHGGDTGNHFQYSPAGQRSSTAEMMAPTHNFPGHW